MIAAVLGAALLGGTAMGFVVLAVLGVALALRGRRIVAIRVTATFGTLWLLWQAGSVLVGISGTGLGSGSLEPQFGRVGDYIAFVSEGLTTAMSDLLQTGWLLVAIGVLALAITGAFWASRVERDHVFLSMLAGALLFYGLVAIRGVAADSPAYTADRPRYMWVATTLILIPSLAWLADRLVEVRRWAALPLAVALGWAVIGNVGDHLDLADQRVALGVANRLTIETAASLSDSLEAAPDGILLAGRSFRITAAQIKRLDSLDKLPCIADYEQALMSAAQWGIPAPTPDQVSCE